MKRSREQHKHQHQQHHDDEQRQEEDKLHPKQGPWKANCRHEHRVPSQKSTVLMGWPVAAVVTLQFLFLLLTVGNKNVALSFVLTTSNQPIPSGTAAVPPVFFVVPTAVSRRNTRLFSTTSSSSSSSSSSSLPEIASMTLKEMRLELDSYGISTKTFLEKREFIQALEQARAEGKQPIVKETTKETTSQNSNNKQSAPASNDNDNQKEEKKKDKEEIFQEARSAAQTMTVKELKQQLTSMGISTRSFFEKSEFVNAYAQAMVDPKRQSQQSQQEPLDPSYRDVVLRKMAPNEKQTLLLSGSAIIDVTASVS